MAVYRQSLHFAALAEAVPARLAFTEAQDVPAARVGEDVQARLAFIMEEEDVVPAARVEEDVPTHSQPTREPSPA
jgi:hypothetical protein